MVLLSLGRGNLTVGRGLGGQVRADLSRALMPGLRLSKLGLFSLEGLAMEIHRLRRPPWPPWSHWSSVKENAFPSVDGRAPSVEGKPELQATALPFLRR